MQDKNIGKPSTITLTATSSNKKKKNNTGGGSLPPDSSSVHEENINLAT